MGKSIELIWIVTKDLKSAVRFYTQVIGLKLKNLHEDFGWAELQGEDGGAFLGIAQKNDYDDIAPGSNAVIAITVQDLEKTKKELISKGAKMIGDILEVPGHVKLQTLIDQDGNRLQLAQQLKSI